MGKKRASKVCRVCLAKTKTYNRLNENINLESEFAALTFFECFQIVTKLNMDAVNLPQQICIDCGTELRTCYLFVRKAQESDLKLRREPESNGENISCSFALIRKEKCNIDAFSDVSDPNAAECDELLKEECLELDNGSDHNILIDASIDSLPAPMCSLHDNTTSSVHNTAGESAKASGDGQSIETSVAADHVECRVCKRLFAPNKYSKHFRKVHSGAPDGFQCPKCPKAFAYPYRLKNHFEIHHGVRSKDVACAVCPKKFYSKKLLNTHMLSHSSTEINHKCELCGKGFQRIAGLRRHIIMHEGGREPCKECGKRFPNLAELRIHMLTHTKETPFLCAICGKGFRRQGPLSYHMRKHRGEKYACVYCGQEFTTISSMRRHEYKHTGLPFKCPRCDAGQATRKILERHVAEVHLSELTAEEIRNIYSSVQNSRLQ